MELGGTKKRPREPRHYVGTVKAPHTTWLKVNTIRTSATVRGRRRGGEEFWIQRTTVIFQLSPLRSAHIIRIRLNGSHEASYLLSHHRLHCSDDNMGIRDFLRIPRKGRRMRSEGRSEAKPIEGGQIDQAAVPHSQPNLGIGSSISPKSVRSTSQSREPSGMRTTVLKGHI